MAPPPRGLRVPVLPDRFAAPPRAPVFAVEDRFAPEVDAFARETLGFAAPELALAALALVALDRAELERVELERPADALPLLLREPPDDEPPLELSSPVHLPDITRCAASATASAMIEPSLVALDITLFAACEAVSAASSPASRILRRADGLALIAAAAAARPAASISLLIAAFASLSIVSLDRVEDPDEPVFEDFAIAYSLRLAEKTLECRNGSLMNRQSRENRAMKTAPWKQGRQKRGLRGRADM